MKNKADPSTTALIVVDYQNDFADQKGSLYVQGGETLAPVLNMLMGGMGVVVYSKDWHPPKHSSFTTEGGQWPTHCIQHTKGSELHKDLDIAGPIFVKGYNEKEDSYSAFGGVIQEDDGDHLSLEEYLNHNNVETVVVVGLAGDYCVKATALDALKRGFRTMICPYATKFVNPENSQAVWAELIAAGVEGLEGFV